MEKLLNLLLPILFFSLMVAAELNINAEKNEILENITAPQHYNADILPSPPESGALEVDINMYVLSINKIDTKKQTIELEAYFRQNWIDQRLKYDHKAGRINYLTITDPDLIWTPDVFFANEQKGYFHDIMKPNVFMKIFPNGKVLSSRSASTSNIQLEKYEVLKNITSPVAYNALTVPVSSYDEPLKLFISTYIRAINKVDSKKETIDLEVTFRQIWIDPRLKFNSKGGKLKHLTSIDEDIIWTPDVFFANEEKGYYHDLMKPNIVIRIYPDGKVYLSKRVTLTLRCPMDLSAFPFDTQTCSWRIESYAYQAHEIEFHWQEKNSVAVAKNLGSPLFSLESFDTEEGTVNAASGNYSFLEVNFVLKRQVGSYVTQMFVPIAMLVILSWTVFWIDGKKLTARALIVVGSLYTCVLLTWHMNEDLPKVPYTKAIDIYTGLSLAFIFAVLLETVTVHFLANEAANYNKADKIKNSSDQENGILEKHDKYVFLQKWISSHSNVSYKMDIACRIVFPLLYLTFNVVYWCVCLCH